MTHSFPYQQYLLVEAAVEKGDIPQARKIIAKVMPDTMVEDLLDRIRKAYAPDAAWRGDLCSVPTPAIPLAPPPKAKRKRAPKPKPEEGA